MKRRMIELEWTREGKADIYIWDGDECDDTGVKWDVSDFSRRARRMPRAIKRLEECLAKRFMTKSSVDHGIHQFEGKRISLLLPAASIVRRREVVVTYGEWEDVPEYVEKRKQRRGW